MIQSEEEKRKNIENDKQRFRDNTRKSNTYATWVPREATENVAEKVSKGIEANKFPKLGEHVNLSCKRSVNPKQYKYK